MIIRTVIVLVASTLCSDVPNVNKVTVKERNLSDDERLALLKPVMTLTEVKRLWQGKKPPGQACGEGVNQLTGQTGGAYWDVYVLKLANSPEAQSMKFGYFQGEEAPYEFRGPGFHSFLQNGKYVAVEGPPKRIRARPGKKAERKRSQLVRSKPVGKRIAAKPGPTGEQLPVRPLSQEPAENVAIRKRWEAIPVPAKTPFDGNARKRADYLRSYRDGYFWAQGNHYWCPTNPQKDNLHAIRGWIAGWKAGVKAGGTSGLPVNYAPYVVWREGVEKPARGNKGSPPAPKWKSGRTFEVGKRSSRLAISFAPDGKTLATAASERVVRLWDVATGKEKAALVSDKGAVGVTTIAFSPDGKTLAAGGPVGARTVLWDVGTRKPRHVLDMDATSLAFSPDGHMLAIGHFKTVTLWDVASGKRLASLAMGLRSPWGIHSVAFSPDGKLLATGAGNGYPASEQVNGEVNVWVVAGWKRLWRSTTPGLEGVARIAWAADGKTLASISRVGGAALPHVRFWEVSTGKERPGVHWQAKGLHARANAIAFAPTGNTLAVGWLVQKDAADRAKGYYVCGVALLDGRTGQEMTRWKESLDVSAVTFAPNGRLLAVGGNAGDHSSVHLWVAER